MLVQFKTLIITLAVAMLSISGARAQTPHAKKAAGGHVMFMPADIKWVDGPPSLPPGGKMAVLQGDPEKKGLFTLRFQMPANYRIPAHWHPMDEHITVISGTFHMGLGDKLDTTKATALPPGGFVQMATGTRHFAWASEQSIIQLHGIGPLGITYVNPDDDPRKKSK